MLLRLRSASVLLWLFQVVMLLRFLRVIVLFGLLCVFWLRRLFRAVVLLWRTGRVVRLKFGWTLA